MPGALVPRCHKHTCGDTCSGSAGRAPLVPSNGRGYARLTSVLPAEGKRAHVVIHIADVFFSKCHARARSHSASNFGQLAIRQTDICRCCASRALLLHLRRCRFAKNSRSSSVTPVFLPGQRRSPARCGNNVHFSECTTFLHVHFQPRFKRLLISCSRLAFILTSSASASTQRKQINVSPLSL